MKIIQQLEDSYLSKVELVEIDGKNFVLKTADKEDIENEKNFFSLLSAHNLPTLQIFQSADLFANQILLEYIPGSPTLGKNLSVEMCKKWGSLMKNIHSIQSSHPAIFKNGSVEYIEWEDCIIANLEKGRQRVKEKKSDLTPQMVESLCLIIKKFIPLKLPFFSLLHGDPHSQNILLRNKELFIFDKDPQIFYGDPLFDLAVIAIEFPHEKNKIFLDAFAQGYGQDVFNEKGEILDAYILLRGFTRYPNPFELDLKEMMEEIIKKYHRL